MARKKRREAVRALREQLEDVEAWCHELQERLDQHLRCTSERATAEAAATDLERHWAPGGRYHDPGL